MRKPDIILAVEPVIDIFENMNIAYYIGGSIASSAHGIARSTIDVDIVADLKMNHTGSFVASLKHQYYVSPEAINNAIKNLLHSI